MIKDLCENEVGRMAGTFYSDILGYDIEVWYSKNIPQDYVEKNIQYINNLDKDFLTDICTAIKRYYEHYKELFPDLCEEITDDILKDFDEDPTSILKYINIGVYSLDEHNVTDADNTVIHLGGDCAWAGDEGITIAAKRNHLLYVGPWIDTFNVWNGHIKDSITGRMFNYAPK